VTKSGSNVLSLEAKKKNVKKSCAVATVVNIPKPFYAVADRKQEKPS
jgi:hypothetical protein